MAKVNPEQITLRHEDKQDVWAFAVLLEHVLNDWGWEWPHPWRPGFSAWVEG